MVIASDGAREARQALPPRFQLAVDAYAMQTGQTEDDVYTEGWRRGEWQERPGEPEAVAAAVAAELEAAFPPSALRPPQQPPAHA
jgi:hypothetical protein